MEFPDFQIEPRHEKTNNEVSEQVRHKPRALYKHGRWLLEAGNFRFRKKRNSAICVAKTKALISFAVTAKLICGFVFAFAKCWFSYVVAQIFYELPHGENQQSA